MMRRVVAVQAVLLFQCVAACVLGGCGVPAGVSLRSSSHTIYSNFESGRVAVAGGDLKRTAGQCSCGAGVRALRGGGDSEGSSDAGTGQQPNYRIEVRSVFSYAIDRV